jgi:hypothetical protein
MVPVIRKTEILFQKMLALTIWGVTRLSWPARLVIIGTTVALAAFGSARAYAGDGAVRAAVTAYSVTGELEDVTAVSSTQAWAVGWSGGSSASKTLIAGWNGQKWSAVTDPKPIPGQLLGLAKVSPTSIWAVGFAGPSSSGAIEPLVMHWNGAAWNRVPGVPTVDGLFDAIGVAGQTLLTVGALSGPPMLIMDRTAAKQWRRFDVPSVPGDLESVVVTGPDSAWAGGVAVNAKDIPYGDVLVHWNGRTWQSVSSFPLHGANQNLFRLAAGPGGAVWAVGDSHNTAMTSFTPISMLRNGATWNKVAVPAPANSWLDGVAFVPDGTAWAAGSSLSGKRSLILSWTGTVWSQVTTPDPFTTTNVVNAVAATSSGDAWAVGYGRSSGSYKTFILHWDGGTWH